MSLGIPAAASLSDGQQPLLVSAPIQDMQVVHLQASACLAHQPLP